MRPILKGLAGVLALACLASFASAGDARNGPALSDVAAATKLDPRAAAMAASTGRAQVIVSLSEQADVSGAYGIAGKTARATYVYERLRQLADRTQPDVLSWLARRGVAAESFYIVNAISMSADGPTLAALAARDDVAAVRLEGDEALIEPVPETAPPDVGRPGEQTITTPLISELGIRAIGADKVWRLGYEGEGIVVAVTDTGAAFKHPAIKKAYRGVGGDHDYNWFDAIDGADEPTDDDGHGTHVTGIVLGVEGVRQIGVAPAAQWIACRLIKSRSGPDSATLKCLEWSLAPTRRDGTEPRPDMAPDIVNASWGSEPGDECEGLPEVRTAVQNLTAAGILFVAAAGNNGSDCSTICAPGTYEETWTVANYDAVHRVIHGSSSRGPVGRGPREIVKPDVAAPGVNIESSVPPSRYGEKSGTSMASPHVAGAAALLLGARPELRGRPEIVREVFEATAKSLRPDKCGPTGAEELNNSAGHGLIDSLAAVVAALSATPPPTPTLTPTPSATSTMTAVPTITPTTVPPSVTPAPRFEVHMPWLARRFVFR